MHQPAHGGDDAGRTSPQRPLRIGGNLCLGQQQHLPRRPQSAGEGRDQHRLAALVQDVQHSAFTAVMQAHVTGPRAGGQAPVDGGAEAIVGMQGIAKADQTDHGGSIGVCASLGINDAAGECQY
ncbi:protein of unknown function [Magnetospirillum gryphiswaldense MSR-1 v2]|uniref:Uncharacterized protein n=1 Tax=Magnetospirillum gryphiswaldense (strain DSM 6361 / JCM 21280 / NBRC 15271 / MSR-1) TaxID=431944 RepID=V6F2H1_MAGGM|nr:protein of unknown function [Magnetospirillum gryphiswaldense MSR-1 v2]